VSLPSIQELRHAPAERARDPDRAALDRPSPAGVGVIVNPTSGERIVVRTSGSQTGGRLLVFDLALPVGSHVPARHVHPVQTERFTVLAGRMRFRLGRRTILADPGDSVVVPPGTPHWFGNAGDGVARARVEVRPALRTEALLEAAEALVLTRRVLGVRLPRFSGLALFLLEFQREVAVPTVPAFLVRAALAPFAWLRRRRASGVAP
jgi:quercetin dioxygenase-like cupin family protein